MKTTRQKGRKELRWRPCNHGCQCLMAAVILLATGCASMELPGDHARSLDAYPRRQTQSNVTMAVEPLVLKKDQDLWFKTEFGRNVLPVLVLIKNEDPSRSYVVSGEAVAVNGHDLRKNPFNKAQVGNESAGDALAIAGSALVSLPLVFAGAKMLSDATVLQHNVGLKQLYSHTLSPGREVHGFVFYADQTKAVPIQPENLAVEVFDLETQQPVRFDFSLK